MTQNIKIPDSTTEKSQSNDFQNSQHEDTGSRWFFKSVSEAISSSRVHVKEVAGKLKETVEAKILFNREASQQDKSKIAGSESRILSKVVTLCRARNH